MYLCWLHSTRSRAARTGEDLVLRRFDTGNLAFISVAEFEQLKQRKNSLWIDILDWLALRPSNSISPVAIPHGAVLLLREVPVRLRRSLGIRQFQEVLFHDISRQAYAYRHALILRDRTRILLQDLCEGVEVTVLCLSPDKSSQGQQWYVIRSTNDATLSIRP